MTSLRVTPMGRLARVTIAVLALAAVMPAGAAADYWDFQGFLHNYPTLQYEYGEFNPDVVQWGYRLSRSNCEAKAIWVERATGNAVQVNIPGGCSMLDWRTYFNGHTWQLTAGRNTNDGCCDVYVNMRIDPNGIFN